MAQELHKYTVQEALALGLGQGGVVTISDTSTHYGRYVSITAIEDSTFAGLEEEGNYCNGVQFESGSTEIKVGQIIEGATSGARAVVTEVNLTGSDWAGGTAAGYFAFAPLSGEEVEFAAAEDLDLLDHNATTISTNVATVVASGGTDGAANLNGKTLTAGTTIYGLFTKIDLATGTVRAAKG